MYKYLETVTHYHGFNTVTNIFYILVTGSTDTDTCTSPTYSSYYDTNGNRPPRFDADPIAQITAMQG